ncbi:MAG: hypothetical protein V3W32_01375, partial [Gemmatimonadota bacterium]
VVGGAQLSEMTIVGGPGPREYVIAVQSAGRLASGNWPMSLAGAAVAAQGAAASSSRRRSLESAEGSGGMLTPQSLSGADLPALHQISETAMRSSARRELLRSGARPAREAARGRGDADAAVGFRTARRALVPAVGERRDFLFSVHPDLTVSCEDTAAVIHASVKAVGEHFAIYRDLQENSGFTAADYAEMLAALEDVVYPVNTSYFGEPADIDGNERIIVLVTEETNKLSGASGLTFIAGFFVPSDLSDSGDPGGGGTAVGGLCATSNEAEILYLIAPDPGGTYGIAHTVEFAKETVIGVSAHELQHLIGAERRLIFGSGGFGDLEDTWVDEGLSHVAEELNGLAAAGLPLRSNLSFEEVVADPDVFNRFHVSNFSRLGQTSGCGGWMKSPEDTQTIVSEDPSGCSGLRYRGFAWIFMRWLGDHEGPSGSGVVPGSGEAALFREIVGGGPTHMTGISNIERAVDEVGSGRSWEALLADFLIAPGADDRAEGAPPRTQILTWDLPDVFLGLHEDEGTRVNFNVPYSLDIEPLGFTTVQEQFSVRSSTAKYFSLASDATAPDYKIRLLDTAGLPITMEAAAQLTIFRVR